ncbi:sensor histidine kinase DivJ [Phenylobacterium zucineum HLK1]|uniref:histidine kinase n=1 Tax=Phenylobacterium zucineum (strain HLK1) TaxID=450851 RepID=B4RHT0_PHEZH|nr:HAMP domain-containing sensor histidine kinase [Phenylobacterium zucineum]ACG79121.1 sensor histidine kinase DivJ [Phenylobacterium zucineum HLK1]
MPYVRLTSARKKRRRPAAPFAAAWHAAVAAVVAGAGAAAVAWGGAAPFGVELPALAVLAAAAIFGALLSLFEGAAAITLLIWAVAAAAAALLTGGAAGPLAAWCLAPMAAASAFRRSGLLALGGALSLGAAAIAALAGVLLPLPPPPAASAEWLALMAMGVIAVGLAAGLIGLQGAHARADRARDEAETELREALDHQPQLLLTLYPGGRILNAFGADLLGRGVRGLKDERLPDLVGFEDRLAVEEALHVAAHEGSAEAAFVPAHDPNGWLEVSFRRLGANRIFAAVRDARAQRAREHELEKARISAEQQNAGKSRFLANMSHELRTPLNAIMGFSDIMRQRLFGPMGDRYGEYAELIHESGSHLLELINDVLDMSKIEAERFELAREDFDARDAVGAVLRLMRGQAERAGVTLRAVMPPEPLEAEADRRAVKQITLNLISNALKFTPRGGTVTVTAQGAGETLELIVADSGVGIAPADLERLGRPFEQAGDAQQRAAGSGLGLSLVRAFAALHGGEMAIESGVGEGTTVTVRMPVLVPPQAEMPAPAPAAEA